MKLLLDRISLAFVAVTSAYVGVSPTLRRPPGTTPSRGSGCGGCRESTDQVLNVVVSGLLVVAAGVLSLPGRRLPKGS
jgi:hypothetical protein